MLAASALGLDVVVVSTSGEPGRILRHVVDTVHVEQGAELASGVAEAVRRLQARGA